MALTINSTFILCTSAILALYHIDLQIATAFEIYLISDKKIYLQIKREPLLRLSYLLHFINPFCIFCKDHFSFSIAQIELHKGPELYLWRPHWKVTAEHYALCAVAVDESLP